MKNYYRILGISVDAEHEEIKAAYRILAQRYHPDKGGDPAEFRIIQEAYDILSNPLTKRPYDRDLFAYLNYQPVLAVQNNSNSWWIIIMSLFAIGGVAFACYVYWQQYQEKKVVTKVITATTIAPPHTIVPSPKPVNKPKRKARASSSPTVVNPLENLSGTNYLVNIGSYTSLNSAAARQSSLKKLGFNTSIQRIDANSEGLTSYNVFIGPYQNAAQAYNLQDKLESQNISAVVERVDAE